MKKILRAFRKDVKDRFTAIHGRKYFHWVEETCRQKVREFFTSKHISSGYHFDENFYDRNEAIFYNLVHCTKIQVVLQGLD